jgi:hypothetical protein
MKTRLSHCVAFLPLSVLLLLSPASARQWNPDSRGAALDYTQILHAKGNGEIVVVWWVVPETFSSVPNSQPIQDVLSRYVVVGVADGHAGANGAMSYGNVADLKITDQTARSLSPLPENVTPPEVTQAISTLQALGRQSLGPVGQGMRWFVFDGSTIHSCTPGKMSVPYGGETYTFEAPIPGCAKQ